MEFKSRVAAGLLVATLGGCAQAPPPPFAPYANLYDMSGEITVPGWRRWCAEATANCERGPVARAWRGSLVDLDRVNRDMNALATFGDYGDQWLDAREIGGGDCEDFAIAKMRALVARGWPAGNFRFAMRQLSNGVPHAVVLVYTGGRWLVLDQLTNDVREPVGRWHLEPRQGVVWLPVDAQQI